jgi:hypothetical protein
MVNLMFCLFCSLKTLRTSALTNICAALEVEPVQSSAPIKHNLPFHLQNTNQMHKLHWGMPGCGSCFSSVSWRTSWTRRTTHLQLRDMSEKEFKLRFQNTNQMHKGNVSPHRRAPDLHLHHRRGHPLPTHLTPVEPRDRNQPEREFYSQPHSFEYLLLPPRHQRPFDPGSPPASPRRAMEEAVTLARVLRGLVRKSQPPQELP